MTAPVLRATSELVAEAWIKSIPGFLAGVATTLPQDTSTWLEHGFVTVEVVGGSAHPYGALRRPVLQIDTWATQSSTPNRTTSRPPWNKASQLAEWIVAETWQEARICRLLTLPGQYPHARVLIATALIEPRKVHGEQVGVARFTVDLWLQWAELPA
jgi:hypothetical protein